MKDIIQYITEEQAKKGATLKPTKEWMEEYYKKFNEELFDNELPKSIVLGLIHPHAKGSDRSLGWQGCILSYYCFGNRKRNGKYIMYRLKPGKGGHWIITKSGRTKPVYDPEQLQEVTDITQLRPFIELNPKFSFSQFQLEDTLIHEMVHLANMMDCLNPTQAHGKEFKQKCDEVRAKAKKLYNVEYNLTTKALHSEDEEKDYQLDPEIQNQLKEKLKKRSSNVVSIYWKIDLSKSKKATRHAERVVFCNRKNLDNFLEEIKWSDDAITEIWVSSTAYEEAVLKYGKFSVSRKLTMYWEASQFLTKTFVDGAENVMKVSEGFLSGFANKVKDIVKMIMSAFVCVSKDTPSSEIDMEDLLNELDKSDSNEEITGDKELQNKAIKF